MEIACPPRYHLINGKCEHFLFPPDIYMILGTLCLCFTNGLATIAGVGGGSIALVILMTFFNYLPKDATMVVFCSILGASIGNVINLITKAHNGRPLIQFHLVFISLPIMFTGSFIGVLLNKLLPSLVICSIIVAVFGSTICKTYRRFRAEYEKQTHEILVSNEDNDHIVKQSAFNPLSEERNIEIFKNIGLLVLTIVVLAFLRGSEKFPSIVGVQPCSTMFWCLFISSFFIFALLAYRNLKISRSWFAPTQRLDEELKEIPKNVIEEHLGELVQKSMGAGVISGFGLGGGIFLVSMYRNMGCTPLEATASSAFGIFITSFINCVQAIAIGSIQMGQFSYFLVVLGAGGYIISSLLSKELRKRHRFSFVEGVLLVLTVTAVVNIPLSLFRKFVNSGYNTDIILGFGSIC